MDIIFPVDGLHPRTLTMPCRCDVSGVVKGIKAPRNHCVDPCRLLFLDFLVSTTLLTCSADELVEIPSRYTRCMTHVWKHPPCCSDGGEQMHACNINMLSSNQFHLELLDRRIQLIIAPQLVITSRFPWSI
jgi:hypothetical protein